jgi:phospholipid transport system substrate-binding protein
MNAGDTDVLVRTEVLQPGEQAVQLDYSLEKKRCGWKVYDVTWLASAW